MLIDKNSPVRLVVVWNALSSSATSPPRPGGIHVRSPILAPELREGSGVILPFQPGNFLCAWKHAAVGNPIDTRVSSGGRAGLRYRPINNSGAAPLRSAGRGYLPGFNPTLGRRVKAPAAACFATVPAIVFATVNVAIR